MQKITPSLWFSDNAEEAVNHYTSIFKRSKVLTVSRYGEAGPGPKGSIMVMVFEIEGQEFMALNGGRTFPYNQSISFMVNCKTQAEIDDLWEKLSAGGEKGVCGWLKDKFGVWWQVVPEKLGRLMSDKDPVRAKRVTEAMLKMTKLDIAELERASNQK